MIVAVFNDDFLPEHFIREEIREYEKETKREVYQAEFHDNKDGTCTERFWVRPVKFRRIRRITGYLVGDTQFFNNAKRAEERDRVMHLHP